MIQKEKNNKIKKNQVTKVFRSINFNGVIIYRDKFNKIHQDFGPAVIYPNGTQLWYKNDRLHRNNGPAAIYPNGTQSWCKNNRYYRKGGLAIIRADGA